MDGVEDLLDLRGRRSPGPVRRSPCRPCSGPRSPSSERLKSCATGSASARDAVAKGEDRDLLSLQQLLDDDRVAERQWRTGARRRARVWSRQTKTPLPAARPSALITHGGRATERAAAVATPAALMTSFANDFEPSILAAAALGPSTAIPEWRSSSATPGTSGASGPTTTRSTSSEPARPRRPSPSSARTGWQRPSVAIPGFPARRAARTGPPPGSASTRARARDRRTRPGAPSHADSIERG